MVIPRTEDKAQPSPEQQLRLEWAANLREELDAKGLTVKGFHQQLIDAGVEVSLQAVYAWLAGNASPSAINQAWCSHVLKAPARRLFPLPEVA